MPIAYGDYSIAKVGKKKDCAEEMTDADIFSRIAPESQYFL